MKRLSSGPTFLGKRVFPAIMGCVAGMMAILISSQEIDIPFFLAIVIGLFAGFLMTIISMRLLTEYMDEVFDAGDHLVIRNRGITEEIDLRDIRNVDSPLMQPSVIWLHLRRDSSFGRSIKFFQSPSHSGYSKLVDSLNRRIKQTGQISGNNSEEGGDLL
ncbi:hypothetical protein JIN85_05145 [Luteolibacter pohnpeiensis]|uniref:Uncharacterized protein n=1 Tax=Luteolibacter pohnpeiensis TaxID=454153 RepID=A0A934S4K5_9BACT|nr:hypothetical protein [Luteolibacter pohnpeiensis]MBK1881788.1 hypothetical protein [Luteolibacter pohnpeiensis]